MTSRFDVYLVPGSSRPGPDGTFDGRPRLRVRASPTKGRANQEAERVLSRLLKAPVTLVGGSRSRRKTFETDLAPGELALRMASVFVG
jgi:uncharacterized protein YggU (UPF0235/DUF167 family)